MPDRWGWLVPVALALVSFVAFVPVLGNGFVNWDDDEYVLDNPHVKGLGPAALGWMWTSSLSQGLYRPLTLMTYAADHLVWGASPFGYHLTSVVLHVLNALVFYALAVHLLRLGGGPADATGLRVAAVVSALLFAVHPLRVEPVAWMSARADLLSALFVLLSVLAYLHSCEAGGPRATRWRLASLGSFALALTAKSSAVALPALLTLLDVYPLRRLGGGPGRWLGADRRAVWWEKVPYWALALPVLPLAFLSKRHAGAAGPLEEYDPALGLAKAAFAVPFHLWKTVAPSGLSPLYQSPPDARPWDAPYLIAGVTVVAVTAALVAARRRYPAALAVWLGYLILILPASGFLSFGPTFAADRYTYVAGLGWTLLAGGGVLAAWRAWQGGRLSPRATALAGSATAVVIASLVTLSWAQARVWRDSPSLWKAVLAVDPASSFAHNNLGLTLARMGREEEAAAHYVEALRLAPALAEAHNNLGLALDRQGRREQAMARYREAIRLKPSLDRAHFNLGNALAARGEWAEAARAFERTLAGRPEFAEAQNNLGVVLVQQGRAGEAVERFRRALELRPDFREARANLDAVTATRR